MFIGGVGGVGGVGWFGGALGVGAVGGAGGVVIVICRFAMPRKYAGTALVSVEAQVPLMLPLGKQTAAIMSLICAFALTWMVLPSDVCALMLKFAFPVTVIPWGDESPW